MFDLTNLNRYRENNKLEVKEAGVSLPQSLWRTYSSFANTQGGIIILGIKELEDKSLSICGVKDPSKLVKDFWDIINNPKKVNVNILRERDVTIEKYEGKSVIVIRVPRADRQDKPVFLDGDFMRCSFRRNGEGDYRCTSAEVKNMLRDQTNEPLDMNVIEEMGIEVLDKETIARYRRHFKDKKEIHPWHEVPDEIFLQKIGAIARSDEDNKLHPTIAGLLMFGYEYEIVRIFPNYFLDYQEKLDNSIRWTDRITSSSGEWSGNIYDFYLKVMPLLFKYLKVPFKLEGIYRVEETPTHIAIREALANALIHSNYYERRGLVVEQLPNEIRISNPGSLRLDMKVAINGGVSDPRNATIMKMFGLLSIGERAGSGLSKIFQTWDAYEYATPKLYETFNPDRTVLILRIPDKRPMEMENVGVNPIKLGINDQRVVCKLDKLGINEVNVGENFAEIGYKPQKLGINSEEVVYKSSKLEVNSENLQLNEKNKGLNHYTTGAKTLAAQIMAILEVDATATYVELSKETHVSEETIRKTLRKLETDGFVKRVGARKNGSWEIINKYTE